MEVILKEDVEKLGDAGQNVKVADGYARNYLLPQGLAVKATASAIEIIKEHMKARAKRLAEQKTDAERMAAEMGKITLVFVRRTADEGRLYGSVTPSEIGNAIIEKGFAIDKRKVVMDLPIKKVGEHKVSIKLHPEVRAVVSVIVNAEEIDQAEIAERARLMEEAELAEKKERQEMEENREE